MSNYIIKAGLVGYPIGHSLSPYIHKRIFALSCMGLEYHMIDTAALKSGIDELRRLDVFNVTIPYKQEIISFLDEVDSQVRGSINTVLNKNGKLCGFTTDGAGCVRAIEAAGVSPCGKILILGNGGTARAIAFELLDSSAESITIAYRAASVSKAARLSEELTEAAGKHIQIIAITYDELEKSNDKYSIIINATSVGMYPNSGVSPVSENLVNKGEVLFDAVYNPGLTRFLGMGMAAEKKLIGGMEMLVYQAVEAHKIWFGTEFSQADVDKLIQDAKAELKKAFPRKNIILCGFMGSGKTAVGRAYAGKADMDFLDLDEYIEQRAGMEINEIFSMLGEEEFRKMEMQAAREISNRSNTVIAVGGGAVLRAENAEIFRKAGRVIFLDTPLEIIQERLKNDRRRPLLRRPDRQAFISKLYAERKPLYIEAAEFTLEPRVSVEEAARKIDELGL